MRKVMIVVGTLVLCTLAGIVLGAITSVAAIEHHPYHSCMDITPLFLWIFYQLGFSIVGLGVGILLSPLISNGDARRTARRSCS